MIQCILTTLGTLASLWLIWRTHKFIFVDRVPKEDYDREKHWHEEATKGREEAWSDRRKAYDCAESSERKAERLEKTLASQTEKIYEVRKLMRGPLLARFDFIMGGGPKV